MPMDEGYMPPSLFWCKKNKEISFVIVVTIAGDVHTKNHQILTPMHLSKRPALP